ncbi:hypothetical protein QOT17_004620 [Balamuthia mandrillaris]
MEQTAGSLDADRLPQLLQAMSLEDQPELRLESCSTLARIASSGSSSQLQALVQAGALPKLIELLSSSDPQLQESACAVIGSTAKAGEGLRDQCLKSGALSALLPLLTQRASSLSLQRQAVWTLSNLCRHDLEDSSSSPADWDTIQHALPSLAVLLYHQDMQVIGDAAWALAYMTDDRFYDRVDAVLQANVARRLVELGLARSSSVVLPVVKTLANIAGSPQDIHRQLLLNCGLLPVLSMLLCHPTTAIRAEAFRALANLALGNAQQLQAILEANLWSPLVAALQQSQVGSTVEKESIRAIHLFVSACNARQLQYVLSRELVHALCEHLDGKDAALLERVLDALDCLLKAAKEVVAGWVEEVKGLQRIDQLQCHESNQVYEKARHLIEAHFEEPEEKVEH